jgi:hypothetical protein
VRRRGPQSRHGQAHHPGDHPRRHLGSSLGLRPAPPTRANVTGDRTPAINLPFSCSFRWPDRVARSSARAGGSGR